MKKSVVSMSVMGAALALGSSAVFAALTGPRYPSAMQVFHPWCDSDRMGSQKSDHSGRTSLTKGESCVGCHEEKGGLNFDMKRLAGKELEPVGAPKTMNFPVTVQSAYDAENLYVRLTFRPCRWCQPR